MGPTKGSRKMAGSRASLGRLEPESEVGTSTGGGRWS